MKNVIIKANILPSKENNFTIKTKDNIPLKEIKRFIIENLNGSFQIELFYNSNTDKISLKNTVNIIENNNEVDNENVNIYNELKLLIHKSKYSNIFEL